MSDDALAVWHAHGAVIDRLLADVGDALQQVAVAGLSFPDPELPDELDVLAARATTLGLARGAQLLGALGAALGRVAASTDSPDALAARREALADAWAASQRLTAWWRLYRIEHDLRTVQGRLALDRLHSAQPATTRAPVATRSLTVRPLGIELDPSGRLLVFALPFGDDRPVGVRAVLLRDQLSEVDRDAPLATPAISRLFQDAVRLGRVLDGVVRLDDHPVTERADAWLFRPAFRSVPRALSLAPGVAEPALPRLDVRRLRSGAHPAVACVVTVTVRWDATASPRIVSLLDDGDPAPWAAPPTLWLSLAKRAMVRGEMVGSLDLVVMPRGDTLLPLHHVDALDARRYLAHDPTAFALDGTLLARALVDAAPDDPAEALFVRAVALLVGGGVVDPAALRADWEALHPVGVDATWRHRWCGWVLGAACDPAEALGWLYDLAAALDPMAPDLAALARLLGRDATQVSTADVALLDDARAARALWLARDAGELADGDTAWATLGASRLGAALATPTGWAVCAQAMVRSQCARDEGEAAAARDFFDGHRASMLADGRAPLCDAMELVHLGDVWSLLRGADRSGSFAAGLGLDRVALALRAVEAVGAWRLEAPGDRGRALRAAEALLLAATAGVLPWVVG